MKKLNDRYYLKSDTYNYILIEKAISTKGKTKGQDTYTNIGYYSTLDTLYASIVEKEIKEDLDLLYNIEKVQQMIKELKESI